MSVLKESCPGSKEIRSPYPEELKCVFCGHLNEIWSDEPDIACKSCRNTINREMKPSCIEWCQFARECVGARKYDRIVKALKKD
jgi:DNA-directed RNA polymerase subunit RPC12/RpoP